MRTNIDIDDALLAEAMEATGARTKKAAVDTALREIVQLYRQRRALEALRGMGWEGDLDMLRDGGPKHADAFAALKDVDP